MADIKLSATRISTFLQCKKRYWLSYVDKLPKLDNPSFKLGIACHTALEFAGNLWKDNNLTSFSKKDINAILEVYDNTAVDEGLVEYSEYKEGKRMLKSKLKNFGIGRKILDLEISFGFNDDLEIFTTTGVPLIGAIDKVVELDDETILIVDYKTSMTIPDTEKLKSDIQLSMYNLVANQLYPQYSRVILCLDMLRKGELIYTYRTQEELDELEHYLKVIYDKMLALTKDDVCASINILCGWCDYRNVCEEYNEVCSNAEYDFTQLNKMSDDELIKEWNHLRNIKKILDTREKEISSIMLDKIKVYESSVKNDDVEMVVRQNARTTYNPQRLSNYIPYEDFVNLVTVSPTKLKKYAEKNPKIKGVLEDVSETSYTSAFLAQRKLKK